MMKCQQEAETFFKLKQFFKLNNGFGNIEYKQSKALELDSGS